MENININFSNALLIKERIRVLDEVKNKKNYENWKKRKSLVSSSIRREVLELSNLNDFEMNTGTQILDDKSKSLLYETLVKKSDWYITYRNIMEKFEFVETGSIEQVISPMINHAEFCIKEAFKKSKNIKFNTNVLDNLLEVILQETIKFFVKPIIVEFNRYKINKEDTIEYKDYFSEILNTKENINKFYSDYPVSLRLSITKIQYLINNIEIFVSRLDNDFEKLNKFFPLKSNIIKKINWSQGDSHEKANSVMIITFDNDVSIVYKPKNLKIVSKFNDFINFLNDKADLKRLETFKSISFEDYHYEEYLENTPVKTVNEVNDYYEKFGYYIAIFHLLCGNDFHLENIIATNKGPIPIDLETLFQNKVPLKLPNMIGIDVKYDLAVESVIGTSLLPVIGFSDNKEGTGIDISALNGKEAKLPFKVLVPKDIDNNNFRYEYDYVTRPGAKNELYLENNKVNFSKYSDKIMIGFTHMINFFNNNKSILTKEIKKFENIRVRNVIKPTSKYMHLLEFSYHPKYLSDMLDREHLLENNWAYPYIEKRPVNSEIEDMLFDDVPIFYSITNNNSLYDCNGKEFKNYFKTSGFEKVIDRLNNIDEKYIEKQQNIMSVALGLYDNHLDKLSGSYTEQEFNSPISNEYILNYIENLVDEIYQTSYVGSEGQVTWANINQHINRWEIESMEVGLYRGLSGMALLYLELYNFTKKIKYKEIYNGIFKTIYSEYKNTPDISAFSGGVSIVYVLLREEHILKTDNLMKIKEIVNYIEHNLDNIKIHDWLGGTAGLLSLMCEIYLKYPNNYFYNIGTKLLDKILKNNLSNSLGFGHGNSGIALSLLKADKVFNLDSTEIYIKTKELLEYENNCIPTLDKHTWCNGTTGIGIARIEMSKICNNPNLNKIILDPIKTTIDNIIYISKKDDCLCHGNMSDIELLRQYLLLNNTYDIRLALNNKLNNFFNKETIITRGLPYIPENNLFLGKCGIAFELLSIINPKDISSPLIYKV